MKTLILIVLMTISSIAVAQPLKDFTFKSPAFNGNGYSAHVLTIENQEHSRKKAIAEKIEAKLKQEQADAENTNVKKFMSNLESRIYAQISQDIATAMFNDDGSSPTSGTLNFEGNVITWDKSSGNIELGVTDMAGTTTTLTIPLGDFTF